MTNRPPLGWATLVLLAGCVAVQLSRAAPNSDDLPNATKILVDERKELNEDTFGAMIREMGDHISDMMTDEMQQLIDEVERRKQSSAHRTSKRRAQDLDSHSGLAHMATDEGVAHEPQHRSEAEQRHDNVDQKQLDKLRNANQVVTQDIRTRIDLLAKDNAGPDLPQASIGLAPMRTFFAQASGKLKSAGQFISEKMNSLGGIIKGVSYKLRKLLHWPDFLNFKIKYNKTYKSLREELYRHMIYLHTQTKVGVQHFRFLLHRNTHLLHATQFADWTADEYHDKLHNAYAEGPDEGGRGAAEVWDADSRAKLVALARAGTNIFGQTVPEHLHANKRPGPASSRRKRSPDAPTDMDIDSDEEVIMSDELDDDEEFADLDGELDAFDPMDVDAGDELETAEELVDEYAAGFEHDAEFDKLDELDEIMDQALDAQPDDAYEFKPIDLRDTGCIIRPENQENCGSCYAHVTAAAAAYYNCMASRRDGAGAPHPRHADRYHARFIASCGRYLTGEGEKTVVHGCQGGRVSSAIEFVRRAGTMLFRDYEFARVSSDTFETDECAYPRPATLDNFGSVNVTYYRQATYKNLNVSMMDLHLRTVGPVFVNMRLWRDFETHGAGIYAGFDDSDNPTIHSMLIVGHDRDARGRDYWIVWNSHGIAWGERGFLRIYTDSLLYFENYIGGLTPNQLAQLAN